MKRCLLIAVLLFSVSSASGDSWPVAQPKIERKDVRLDDGREYQQFTLTNDHGTKVVVVTYGATIIDVMAVDRDGKAETICLRLDRVADYYKGHPLFGSTVGRFANRIGKARFEIDGVAYDIEKNAGQNHIHGGRNGFQKRDWQASTRERDNAVTVEMTLKSPDGDAGYPGNVDVTAGFTLTSDNRLILDYRATTDRPTHVNLTNHAYWNLGGVSSGTVLDHKLTINADQTLSIDERKVPDGKKLDVEGTAFDFRKPQTIGSRIDEVPGGYDHCYVLNVKGADRTWAATAYHPKSGREMKVSTTQPGVQLYTANGLNDRYSYQQRPYGKYHGFCLETQHFPNTPNQPDFPTTLIRPGKEYRQRTVIKFGVRE